MGLNPLNSSNDPICPTYGVGTVSIISAVILSGIVTTGDFLNDSASASGANGYTNNFNLSASEQLH